jgi:excisionase family DNA binding protein
MEKLLTVEQFADGANLSKQGAYRAAREKQIPTIRIGRQIRIPESALAKWIAEQLNSTTSPIA